MANVSVMAEDFVSQRAVLGHIFNRLKTLVFGGAEKKLMGYVAMSRHSWSRPSFVQSARNHGLARKRGRLLSIRGLV